MQDQPIFILGAPRSGTTFLASLLESSPYGAPFETQFITKYYKRLDQYGDLNKLDNLKKLLSDICTERAVMQWGIQFCPSELQQQLPANYNYADIVHQLCLRASQEKGNQNWGDKTPHYLGDLDILIKLFPHSKFIFIVRDGRDVALSLLKKLWGPNNIYYCAKYWKDLNSHDNALSTLRKKGQLFELRYEDLTVKPEHSIKELFKFLDLTYSHEKLAPQLSTTKSDNSAKWRQELSLRQIEIFEKTAGNTLIKHGYQTTYTESDIGPIKRLLYYCHQMLHRAKHLFVVNIIDGIKIRFFNKSPFAE